MLRSAAARCASENRNYTCEYDQCSPALILATPSLCQTGDLSANLLSPGRIIMYTDDAKTFGPVRQPSDYGFLQECLDLFCSWCKRNGLTCIQKCSCVSFSRGRNPNSANYYIENTAVKREACVKDLGVMLDVVARRNKLFGVLLVLEDNQRTSRSGMQQSRLLQHRSSGARICERALEPCNYFYY